jgi:Fic family protein
MVGIRRSGQNSGAASDTGCRAVARFRILTRMLNVSTHGGWEAWIRFCLEGVVAQSVDAERRCDKLLALHKDFHNRLKVGSVRLSKLVDHLFSSPVISVNQYKRLFSVTYPTARSDLKKLEAAGIVQQLEQMVEITYYCQPIYGITFEDISF